MRIHDGFLWELFQKGSLPNIEKLRLACGLELMYLGYLESIGLEKSWIAPVLANLETLIVQHCPRLRHLVLSAISFTKLRDLYVNGCEGLLYLFTSSAAKSLALLEELFVWRCQSIQEIMAKGDKESDEDEITFGNLKKLIFSVSHVLIAFTKGHTI
ncbi:hypothetical protein K1719_015953 [Acacia pycnantha]|nr:hypothetical protein K1719_015953 [Acacia pycnantha]